MKEFKLTNINKKYFRKSVLKDINLTINSGEIIGVLGLNGSGKTTLLKIMSGNLNPTSGSVLFDDKSIDAVDKMQELIYVPDQIIIPKHLKVSEVAELFMIKNPNYNQFYLEKFLVKLGIDASSKIRTLSKGNQELVQLGILLANTPQMIILDEPLGAVDVVKRAVILDLLIDLQMDGVTIVLSTHLIQDIEAIMSRVIIINDYQITFDQEVEVIQNSGKSIQETLITKVGNQWLN